MLYYRRRLPQWSRARPQAGAKRRPSTPTTMEWLVRFFMEFRRPQAVGDRRQKPIVSTTFGAAPDVRTRGSQGQCHQGQVWRPVLRGSTEVYFPNMKIFASLVAAVLILPLTGQQVANVSFKLGRDLSQPVDEEYTRKYASTPRRRSSTRLSRIICRRRRRCRLPRPCSATSRVRPASCLTRTRSIAICECWRKPARA